MQQWSVEGERIIHDLAQRYRVSDDAVRTLAQALIAGNGTMAQFNHAEFGGSGQWMRGGMTMVGDMFNHSLKASVDALLSELSGLMASQPDLWNPQKSPLSSQTHTPSHDAEVSLRVSAGPENSQHWWPSEPDLGKPGATGAQNNIRYAYFPETRRLAIDINGHVTVYDTLDHQISGVSQQQSSDASLTFTSSSGLVRVGSLPVVSDARETHANNGLPSSINSADTL